MNIKEFINKFEKIIPNNLALSFDNVGLLIGSEEREITGIYVCLDINDDIIEYVRRHNVNTIISHHPIIFNPLKRVVDDKSVSRKIMKCISYDINVISYHTNLDAAINGMNDKLVNILNFEYKSIEILELNSMNSKCGIGRILNLKKSLDIMFIIDEIKEKFNIDKLKFVDSGNKEINKVCVINGSGNSMIKTCFGKNIDLVITGDITYHTAFESIENKVSLIDMGHFNSENIVYIEVMKNFIQDIIEKDISVYYDSLLTDVYKYV